MKARERIKRIIKEANDMGELKCSDNDATAMRRADKLLEDMAQYFALDHAGKFEDCVECDLLRKARALGYMEES